MSIKALEWAAKAPGITRLERTVLKEIANRYNEQKGRAWPSQARMARDTGYSRSSINRGLNGLEKKGLAAHLRVALCWDLSLSKKPNQNRPRKR